MQKYEGQGWNCVKRRETFLLFMFKHGTPKCMNSNSFQSTGNIKLHVILLFFRKKKTKKSMAKGKTVFMELYVPVIGLGGLIFII